MTTLPWPVCPHPAARCAAIHDRTGTRCPIRDDVSTTDKLAEAAGLIDRDPAPGPLTTNPCVICGFDSTYHEGDGEMIHDFRAYPVTPSPADPAAERIAAALRDRSVTVAGFAVLSPMTAAGLLVTGSVRDLTAALLPVVAALAAERAAEELRKAAETAPVMRFDNGYPVRAVPVSDLLSFAAALRAAHHTDSEGATS